MSFRIILETESPEYRRQPHQGRYQTARARSEPAPGLKPKSLECKGSYLRLVWVNPKPAKTHIYR
jgi:hypothetical protein